MVELTDRQKLILKLIVEDFVETAFPVSSRSLCKKHDLGISPATVRNTMMDLEEMGLLYQTHVSAGRIPTDLGYRVYVDMLMPVPALFRTERRKILERLRKVSQDVELVLQKASQILAEISNQLGIVALPRLEAGIFDRLELVPVTSNRTLLVINIKSGLVKTIMLELDFDISRDILAATASILNERLHGLSLAEIKRSIGDRLQEVSGGHPRLLNYFTSSADQLFDFEDWEDYYYGGAANILRQPEFMDVSRFEQLISFLENKHSIIQFLENVSDQRPVRISIGRELPDSKLSSCGVVTSEYRIGNVRGTIGIIGPMRMDYGRMVSIVRYVSKAITSLASN